MKRASHASGAALAAVIGSLLVLTGLSLGASYLHLPGVLGVVVALGIAAVKVTLVVLFFMELRDHRGGARLVALTGPAFVATLILLMLAEVWAR
jgi:cytochrome c oxidase subunit 4